MCSNEQIKRAKKGRDVNKFIKKKLFLLQNACQSRLKIIFIWRHYQVSKSVFIDLARFGNDESRAPHNMECTHNNISSQSVVFEQMASVTHEGTPGLRHDHVTRPS